MSDGLAMMAKSRNGRQSRWYRSMSVERGNYPAFAMVCVLVYPRRAWVYTILLCYSPFSALTDGLHFSLPLTYDSQPFTSDQSPGSFG